MRANRIDTGLTQAGLGERSGVAKSYICRIEAGQRTHPAPAITKRLAAAMQIPMGDLLVDEQASAQP